MATRYSTALRPDDVIIRGDERLEIRDIQVSPYGVMVFVYDVNSDNGISYLQFGIGKMVEVV